MSILDRLNTLIRAEINDLSGRGSFGNAMKEAQSSVRDARRQKAELRRAEANLVKQIRAVREKAARWEERAMLALKGGEEDLAREALMMKNRQLDEASRLRDELDDYRAQIQDLERALEALEIKLEGARGRLRTDSSRAHATDETAWDRKMRQRMSKREGGRQQGEYLGPLDEMDEEFGTSRSFREFDRMSSKINAMEADIEAMRELSDDDLIDPRRKELEDIFGRMEKKKRTDDDLSDLKKKFE
jgi:phage shock protein A